MSKPEIIPTTTTSGIAVNPRTLERVIPESRRPDGTVRKEIKIRPGFTPQEDVSRFRGSRQKQMDHTALPKGHIIGWTPPPTSTAAKSTGALSKSAKKNAKRKEKRDTQKVEESTKVKDSWEDDDEEEAAQGGAESANTPTAKTQEGQAAKPNEDANTDALVEKLEKLDVQ